MNTKGHSGKRPLYRRKKFWVAVAAVALIAAGIATFYLTKEAGISLNPSAQAERGNVEIYTAPEDAEIYVDGKERKETSPAKFSLPLGKHTIVLKLDGYDEATIPIEVISANPVTIEQTFTKQGTITTDERPDEFQTYTNETYKYRIKHPSNWKTESGAPQVVNFLNTQRAQKPGSSEGEEQTSLSILTQPNPGNLSPADWYKARQEYSQEDQSQIKTRELTVNGRQAFQYETPYGFVPYVNTIVTGNGQTFILQQAQTSPERSTYDQVIQTFTLF